MSGTIFNTKRVERKYKGFVIKGVIRPRTMPSTWTASTDGEEVASATSEARLKEMLCAK